MHFRLFYYESKEYEPLIWLFFGDSMVWVHISWKKGYNSIGRYFAVNGEKRANKVTLPFKVAVMFSANNILKLLRSLHLFDKNLNNTFLDKSGAFTCAVKYKTVNKTE